MEGLLLTEENCKVENFEEMDEKLKSSAFWLAFKDYEGRTVTSERRFWGLDFQIDKEANIGKTDFKVKIR